MLSGCLSPHPSLFLSMSLGLNFMLCCKWSHFLSEEIRSYLFYSLLLSPGKFWAGALELDIGKMDRKILSESYPHSRRWALGKGRQQLEIFLPFLFWHGTATAWSRAKVIEVPVFLTCCAQDTAFIPQMGQIKGAPPHYCTCPGLILRNRHLGQHGKESPAHFGQKVLWLGAGGRGSESCHSYSPVLLNREGWGDDVVWIIYHRLSLFLLNFHRVSLIDVSFTLKTISKGLRLLCGSNFHQFPWEQVIRDPLAVIPGVHFHLSSFLKDSFAKYRIFRWQNVLQHFEHAVPLYSAFH